MWVDLLCLILYVLQQLMIILNICDKIEKLSDLVFRVVSYQMLDKMCFWKIFWRTNFLRLKHFFKLYQFSRKFQILNCLLCLFKIWFVTKLPHASHLSTVITFIKQFQETKKSFSCECERFSSVCDLFNLFLLIYS